MKFWNLRTSRCFPAMRNATLQTMAVANAHEDQLEQTAVVTTIGALSDIAWSADSKSLTYKSGGAVWRVLSPTCMETEARRKRSGRHAASPDHGRPDSAWVYYADSKSGKLWRVRPNGSGRAHAGHQ